MQIFKIFNFDDMNSSWKVVTSAVSSGSARKKDAKLPNFKVNFV